MNLAEISVGLLSAERRLKLNLHLILQPDGSGAVMASDDDRTVFHFDYPFDLESWLKRPRVVAYDEEGQPRRTLRASGEETHHA